MVQTVFSYSNRCLNPFIYATQYNVVRSWWRVMACRLVRGSEHVTDDATLRRTGRSSSRFKKITWRWLPTRCTNLVSLRPVTSEFATLKGANSWKKTPTSRRYRWCHLTNFNRIVRGGQHVTEDAPEGSKHHPNTTKIHVTTKNI